MRLRLLRILLVVMVAGCLAANAAGQATISSAQLNGTVLDTSGRAVVGAAIALRNLDTNQVYNAASNSSGFYVVPSLAPGRYELKVQNTGFATYVQTGISLTVGQTATVDVSLKVASTTEVVNV
ncbi:MAG TPA: carboxypeptidase-like regulatory domain-containing protein, partial [Terriglobales bacterium]